MTDIDLNTIANILARLALTILLVLPVVLLVRALNARERALAVSNALAFRTFDREKAKAYIADGAATVSLRGDAELYLALWVFDQLAKAGAESAKAEWRDLIRERIDRHKPRCPIVENFSSSEMWNAANLLGVDADVLVDVAREVARQRLSSTVSQAVKAFESEHQSQERANA